MTRIDVRQPGTAAALGAAAADHDATHLPGGSDAIDYAGSVHMAGTAASRPAAAAGNAGCLYFSTDTGVLWRSTGSAWARVSFDSEALMVGGVGRRSPFPRYAAPTNLPAFTSGVLALVALPLYAGDVVSNLTFQCGSTALVMGLLGGNLWFALYAPGASTGATGALLAQSADQGGSATWSANTAKTLALSSPQTIATTGVHFAGVMVNTGSTGTPTMPTLRGAQPGSSGFTGSIVTGVYTMGGTNGSGLTDTAPAGPLTITNNANLPYCLTT